MQTFKWFNIHHIYLLMFGKYWKNCLKLYIYAHNQPYDRVDKGEVSLNVGDWDCESKLNKGGLKIPCIWIKVMSKQELVILLTSVWR